jgi:hypothetical protein
MNFAPRSRLIPVLSSLLLGGTLLTSCSTLRSNVNSASAPAENSTELQQQVMRLNDTANEATSQKTAPVAAVPAAIEADGAPASQAVPQAQLQLIKTAELTVRVEVVEASIKAATAIARQQQGDVLNLQDQTPQNGGYHIASLQVRVPQAKLDATLAELENLGTVQRQTVTAEDVSNQLVDYQARLRNLRKAEETVLKIMDRSGNVADVLKVAQELNNIRSSIEQIDAQLQDLRNRVAYSTITLSLQALTTTVTPPPAATTQLQETWKNATRSIGKVTVDLLQLGLWLMVYSPYLLLIAGAATLGYAKLRRSPSVSTPSATTDS